MKNLIPTCPSAEFIPDDDFTSAQYLSEGALITAKGLFNNQGSRQVALNMQNPIWDSKQGYGYNGTEEIYSTFYSKMWKTILQCPTLTQQKNIVALRFEWYINETSKSIHFKVLGLDKDGNAITAGDTASTGNSGTLYKFLRTTTATLTLPTISTQKILEWLGYTGTLPACGVNTVGFIPILINSAGSLYFALATATPNSAEAHAYGPPCPPECYPVR